MREKWINAHPGLYRGRIENEQQIFISFLSLLPSNTELKKNSKRNTIKYCSASTSAIYRYSCETAPQSWKLSHRCVKIKSENTYECDWCKRIHSSSRSACIEKANQRERKHFHRYLWCDRKIDVISATSTAAFCIIKINRVFNVNLFPNGFQHIKCKSCFDWKIIGW